MSSRDQLELERIRAIISKSLAETEKLHAENRYYPIIVTATVTATVIFAVAALVKLFL